MCVIVDGFFFRRNRNNNQHYTHYIHNGRRSKRVCVRAKEREREKRDENKTEMKIKIQLNFRTQITNRRELSEIGRDDDDKQHKQQHISLNFIFPPSNCNAKW